MKLFNKEEYNKLCADFLEWKLDTSKNEWVDNVGLYVEDLDCLKFDTDWNWIIEVVEKIESTKRSEFSPNTTPIVEIRGISCSISFYGNWKENITNVVRPTKKEAVVQAVWEFLQWYNN